jgi:hypothetical protein
MTWTEFSFIYFAVNLAILAVACHRLSLGWGRLIRTLVAAAAILIVFDALAENRRIWSFPRTLGLEILGVPIENVWIILGSATNSLLCFLFFDGRPRGQSSRASR